MPVQKDNRAFAWQVPGRLYSPWLTYFDLIPDGTLTALIHVQDGFDGYAAFNPEYPVNLVAAGEGYDPISVSGRWSSIPITAANGLRMFSQKGNTHGPNSIAWALVATSPMTVVL